MYIYLGMFLISEFFCLLYRQYKKSADRTVVIRYKNFAGARFSLFSFSDILLVISAIPFLLVASLRYYVGTDYGTYLRLQIPEVMRGINWRVELLYRYVIKLGMFLGHTQWVFAITHLLIIYFVWKAIKKESPHIGWSVFVFMFGTFFNNSLNLMRQFIGMAICLYAIRYIYRKDLKHYIIYVLIATLFHRSLIVYIPIYFLLDVKIKPAFSLTIPVVCSVSARLIRKVMFNFANLANLYTTYFNDVRYDVNNTQVDFIVFEYLILIICIYCSASKKNIAGKNSDDIKTDEAKRNLYLWLQTISTIVASLSRIIPNSTRIIMLLSIGQIIYIPFFILQSGNEKKRKLVSFLFLCIYIIIFYRVIIVRGVGNTLPYQFIF